MEVLSLTIQQCVMVSDELNSFPFCTFLFIVAF